MVAEWSRSGGTTDLQESLRISRCSLRDLMARAGPRVVGPTSSDPPALVFTDGACEDEISIGAVL
eukprot:1564770-Karenia_brevis.AAC.1